MTPGEISTAAREQYNAVNDTFFGDTELYSYIYDGSLKLAQQAYVVEGTYETSTVASQQEYDFPANILAVKRLTWNGQKLDPITFREDDVLTLTNQSSTETGNPLYYAIWNETFYLRPVPSTVQTLKVFAYVEPQSVLTASQTLEVPSRWHMALKTFVLYRMALKDTNTTLITAYRDEWAQEIKDAKKDFLKRKRGDAFHVVKDVDMLAQTIIGAI